MLGLIMMLAVSALIAWLASLMIGTVGGIVVGIAVFVIWFRFNQKQGTTGLYKANLYSYFAYRRKGQTVGDALQSMIQTRYPFSEDKLNAALSFLSEIPESESDEMRVIEAIFSIFCLENGRPPDSRKYRSEIQGLYTKMSKTHGWP